MHRRGGVAAGDSSNSPSQTTFAPFPPSSTYSGPTIAGSKEGFISVTVVVGLLFLAAVGGALLYMRRRSRVRRSEGRQSGSRGARSSGRDGRGWRRAEEGGGPDDDDDDEGAFEMPAASFDEPRHEFEHEGAKRWLNPSTMSLDLDDSERHSKPTNETTQLADRREQE